MHTSSGWGSDPPPSRRDQILLAPDIAERISAGCYGALVAATTLIEAGDVRLVKLIALVVLTNVMYFATHVFAYTIGDQRTSKDVPLGALYHHLRVSAPIVPAAFVPLIVVIAVELLGLGHQVGVLAGVTTAVVLLAAVTALGARLRRLSPVLIVLLPAASIVISLGLLTLKTAIK